MDRIVPGIETLGVGWSTCQGLSMFNGGRDAGAGSEMIIVYLNNL
jgi:hypothetical protein